MNIEFSDIKESLCDEKIYSLLAPSVFEPTPERLADRAERYIKNADTSVYSGFAGGEYKGIVVFKITGNSAEILDIAVKEEDRGKGIGTAFLNFIFSRFDITEITAETDDEAVGFYKKYGFRIAGTKIKFNTVRYICVCENVVRHYDLLVKENNDPVRDPQPLREYMDKWDGQEFIDEMELDKAKSVLEVGVGTGRLAVRTAPFCGDFCGIDISPKTVERAEENLSGYKNVTLICGDFLNFRFDRSFDIIYSSPTFMHIKDKRGTVNKIARLLNHGGRFILSLDKNKSEFIDTGTSRIKIYPDDPDTLEEYIKAAGLTVLRRYETEHAFIIVSARQ